MALLFCSGIGTLGNQFLEKLCVWSITAGLLWQALYPHYVFLTSILLNFQIMNWNRLRSELGDMDSPWSRLQVVQNCFTYFFQYFTAQNKDSGRKIIHISVQHNVGCDFQKANSWKKFIKAQTAAFMKLN